MPNITEFAAPDAHINISEVGLTAFARLAMHQDERAGREANTFNGKAQEGAELTREGATIGRAISVAGGAAQRFVDQHQAQTEISKLSATFTNGLDSMTDQWNALATQTDPHDTSITDKFKEKVLEPFLTKTQELAETQQGRAFALQRADALRNHFSDKMAADVSNRAGQAAMADFKTVSTRSSNAANKDPSSIDINLDNIDAYIKATKATSPGITADTAAKIEESGSAAKTETVKAGMLAMADRNPTQFLSDLQAGKFDQKYGAYITGEERQQLEGYATAKAKLAVEGDRAQAAEQRRQQTQAADTAANKAFVSTYDPSNGSFHVDKSYYDAAMEVAKMPGVSPSLPHAMVSAGRAITDNLEKGVKSVDEPSVYEDFRNRMFLSPDDPKRLTLTEVFQARGEGHLSDKSFAFYKEAVTGDVRDPQKVADQKQLDGFFGDVKSQIMHTSPLQPPGQWEGQRWLEYQRDMTDQYRALRAQGKSSDEILGVNGPLFRSLQRYRLSPDQQQKEMVEGISQSLPALPAVTGAPGPIKWDGKESMDDLYKRLGK